MHHQRICSLNNSFNKTKANLVAAKNRTPNFCLSKNYFNFPVNFSKGGVWIKRHRFSLSSHILRP